MKKILVFLLVVLSIIALVSCDPGLLKKDPDQQQSGEEGGGSGSGDSGSSGGQSGDQGDSGQGDSQSKETYTVTFVQEGLDNVVATYDDGDLLWFHAPDLPRHNLSGYYYNWDKELDSAVTSDMTVTRTENEGLAVFFMSVDEHAVKIIGKNKPASWGTLKVEDFPAPPAIGGYTGFWEETEDIGYFSSSRMDVGCWYYSNDKYSSTGMPKSFIIPGLSGRIAFAISEYPIKVADSTLTYINKTNFDKAISGLTTITSSDASSVINKTRGVYKDTFNAYSIQQKTTYLIQETPTVGFVNAIKVMRQQTGDDGWSIPMVRTMGYVLRVLCAQGKEGTYYGYLSENFSEVRCVTDESFYLDSGNNKRMVYPWIEASYGPVSSDWHFGIDGTFSGYLWPIKMIE